MKRLLVLFVCVLVLTGCNGSPTEPNIDFERGRLAGLVKIGPICPVEHIDQPCPTPPSAYAARKILVYDAAKTALLFTVDIDSQGLYYIDLKVGTYTIDFKGGGADRSSELPKVVTIKPNQVTTLDVSIDTGLR